MANEEIRKLIRTQGLYHYEIADSLGLHDTAFSRLLRKELSEEKKKEIYEVVERLTTERLTGGVVNEKK